MALTAKPLRRPVAPQIFLRRAMYFELILALTQFIHLLVFSDATPGDFVTWTVVHGMAQLALALLRRSARHCIEYAIISWKVLATLMLIVLAFKLYGRVPYIQSWLSAGLLETRLNDDLGGGGWYSYGSIFFYPLSILLAFSTLPRTVYRWLLFFTLMLCSIDFIALGTRNAPVFVLIFHLLSVSFRFKRKYAPRIIAVLAIFVAIFNYSTVNRSLESAGGSFDWLVLFEFTGSTQVLKINNNIVRPIASSVPALMPVIFLSHYVTHPIAELNYFVSLSDHLPLGGLYQLHDQFCVIGFCNRDDSQWLMEKVNPRFGVYQTIWASLILDFGWFGSSFLVIVIIAIMYAIQRLRPRQLGIGTIVFAQMIMLSPIENYFYNALGLVQTMCIILVFYGIRILCWLLTIVPNRSTSDLSLI